MWRNIFYSLDSKHIIETNCGAETTSLALIATAGEALSGRPEEFVFFCVLCVDASIDSHLAPGLDFSLSPCLAERSSFILSAGLSFGACACVSMGEMTTGLPAVLTTCSPQSPFSFTPPPSSFTPLGCSSLTSHVVLSCPAFHFVMNCHVIQPFCSHFGPFTRPSAMRTQTATCNEMYTGVSGFLLPNSRRTLTRPFSGSINKTHSY